MHQLEFFSNECIHEGQGFKSCINRLLNLYLERGILPLFDLLSCRNEEVSTTGYIEDVKINEFIVLERVNEDIENVGKQLFPQADFSKLQILPGMLLPDISQYLDWISRCGYKLNILSVDGSQYSKYLSLYAAFLAKTSLYILNNLLQYRFANLCDIACSYHVEQIIKKYTIFLFPYLSNLESKGNCTVTKCVCQPKLIAMPVNSTFQGITHDIHMVILSFVDTFEELLNARLVCQYWNALIMDEYAQYYWKNLMRHYITKYSFFENVLLEPFEESSWLKLFMKYIVPKMKQREEIHEVLEVFLGAPVDYSILDKSLYINYEFEVEECDILDEPIGSSLIMNDFVVTDLPQCLLNDNELTNMQCVAQINLKTFPFGTGIRARLPSFGMIYFFKDALDLTNKNVSCKTIIFNGTEEELIRSYSEEIRPTCNRITNVREYLVCSLKTLDIPKLNLLSSSKKESLKRNLDFSKYKNLFCSYPNEKKKLSGEICFLELTEPSGKARFSQAYERLVTCCSSKGSKCHKSLVKSASTTLCYSPNSFCIPETMCGERMPNKPAPVSKSSPIYAASVMQSAQMC